MMWHTCVYQTVKTLRNSIIIHLDQKAIPRYRSTRRNLLTLESCHVVLVIHRQSRVIVTG
jgi:hypothetical protein